MLRESRTCILFWNVYHSAYVLDFFASSFFFSLFILFFDLSMKGRFLKKNTPPLEKNIQRLGVRYSYKCFQLPFDLMLMICSSPLQDQIKMMTLQKL